MSNIRRGYMPLCLARYHPTATSPPSGEVVSTSVAHCVLSSSQRMASQFGSRRRGSSPWFLSGEESGDVHHVDKVGRSDERRVGKECVSQGNSRWSPDN